MAYDAFFEVGVTGPGQWWARRTDEAAVRAILRHCALGPDDLLAEIGPGRGGFARVLASATDCRYLGIELNEGGARGLREAGFDVVCARVPPFPLADRVAKVVYAAHVIEHMADRREAMAFVAEARRVLIPRGLVVVLTPNVLDYGAHFFADYTQ